MDTVNPPMDKLKLKLLNGVLDLSLYLGQSAAQIIDQEYDVIQRDYHSTSAMLSDKDNPDPENYVSTILEGHMDTLVKTVINLVVAVITEMTLVENGTTIDLPDLVEYIRANKEKYDLN